MKKKNQGIKLDLCDILDEIVDVTKAAAEAFYEGAREDLHLYKEALREAKEDFETAAEGFRNQEYDIPWQDTPDVTGSYSNPFNSPFSTIEDLMDQESKKILVKKLEDSIKGGDKFAKILVREATNEVYGYKDDTVLRAHAKACVYAGDLALAADSYRRSKKLSPKEATVLGMISYNQGRMQETRRHLAKVVEKYNSDTWAPEARLVIAHSIRPQIIPYPVEYIKPIIGDTNEKVPEANLLLGELCFNNGEYERAEEYFEKLLEAHPTYKKGWLALLRSKHAGKKGAEAYRLAGDFLHETGAKMSEAQLQMELEQRHMPIERYFVRTSILTRILES